MSATTKRYKGKKYENSEIIYRLSAIEGKVDRLLGILTEVQKVSTKPSTEQVKPSKVQAKQDGPMMVEVYTDGSCSGTSGGWAYSVSYSDGFKYNDTGSTDNTTNNRMEMMAAIEALDNLKMKGDQSKGMNVTVNSDSKYLVDGINSWIHNWKKNGWTTGLDKSEVKNKDLWQRLDKIVEMYRDSSIGLKFKWVRGHSGDTNNIAVDKLAVSAMRRSQQLSML